MSADVIAAQTPAPRQTFAVQPNGVYGNPRSNMPGPQIPQFEEENGHIMPGQVNDALRKGNDSTANGTDPDGMLDYYKPDGRNGNKPVQPQNKDRRKKATAVWTEAEKDESNWIHRDKLKEIEIREMEQLGYKVGRTSRSNSTSQSATRNRSRKGSEATNNSHSGDDRQDHRPAVSPIPAEEEDVGDEPPQWDLRTPDEIAAEREREMWATPPPRQNHVIRPSTSRIPVAKISPAPVPSNFVERDAPLPRSRKGSANWTGEPISVRGARVRSGSTSSAILLDEPKISGELLRTPNSNTFSNATSPVTGSPPKSKTPGKPTPTSGARKTSAQRSASQSKPRVTSATSPTKRPGTSGGSISRPTTSHRPEGEAPWIATMYKPDPRLPPDQQIIPTHAKRMQQEQWENEGRVGSMYDRDFRLLNTEEFKDKRLSQINPLDLEKQQDDGQWPLPSPTKLSPDQTDDKAKSPTTEQGGYKLTPTIPQSPRTPSRSEPRQAPAIAPNPPKTTRMPEPQDDDKEKKGCCCIVM